MFFNRQLLLAFVPIVFLILMLFINIVYVFQDSGLDGSNQIILLLATGIVYACARINATRWNTLLKGILKNIETAMPAILILLMIGALGGTWLISGIIPSMVYYGLKILNPSIFLVAACIISAIVSLATGSSWATIATIGIALLGMSRGLGINSSIAAGAIISGAYFGDKISPLSDTTNLAPVITGTDVFTHIRFMFYTSIPSIFITLVIFFIIGFFHIYEDTVVDTEHIFYALENTFYISPVLFIAPALVIFLIIKRQDTIKVLFIGSVFGGIIALIFQQNIIQSLYTIEDGILKANYAVFLKAMYGEIQIIGDNEMLNKLFKSTGMAGMLNTIWLILCAMIFGGAMQASGFLKTITTAILKLAKTTTSLVISTVSTCLFCNIAVSDQYLAIIVPGKMFSKTFEDENLKPEGLSRTLEDSATVTSVLVPWNTCGATQQGVLGVATFSYLPYCFFNIISPIMTVIFAIFFTRQYKKVRNSNDKLQEIDRNTDYIEKKNQELNKAYSRVQDSIRYAGRIQQAILNKEEEIKGSFKDYFILFLPKDMVSGDFYWFKRVKKDNSISYFKVLIVADCTGHGVPAALLTVIGNDIINDFILQNPCNSSTPALLLKALDEKIKDHLHNSLNKTNENIQDGMDVSVLLIDEEERTIHYAGAKRPLYYHNNQGLKVVKGDNIGIGDFYKYKEIKFTNHTFHLQEKEEATFYLFTDGIIDQFDEANYIKFSSKRFRALIERIHKFPMEQQQEIIREEFLFWKGSNKQIDDILVIGAKV